LAGALLQIWAGNTPGKCYTVVPRSKQGTPDHARVRGGSATLIAPWERALSGKGNWTDAPREFFLKGTFWV
jgi:hypothetical protein